MEPESCSTDAAPAAGASGTREQMNKLPGVAAVMITSGPTRGERISRCWQDEEERPAHVHGWGQQDREGDSSQRHMGRGEVAYELQLFRNTSFSGFPGSKMLPSAVCSVAGTESSLRPSLAGASLQCHTPGGGQGQVLRHRPGTRK
ncbi:uncharacterized protein LOC141751445 isoform X7 [Larus michahellis]|uniref:uncharacterized protein LOC141751445 isoform X7 n=1 Tax=Larus michahellis TaxID=119627 RepID=UPI003D9BEF54